MKECNYLWIQEKSLYIQGRFDFVCEDVSIWIACQFALESAYGMSVIAMENYNISGMKKPCVRLSTCIGEKHGHAVYPSWMSCVCDYFYWCQYNGFTQSSFKKLSTFLNKFKNCNYCPSSVYLDSIQSIYKSFKSYTNE